MDKEILQKIPIFHKNAPTGAKISLLLLAFVLCAFVHTFHPLFTYIFTKAFSGSAREQAGSIFLIAFIGSFLIINVCVFLGVGFRKNWARIVGLLIAAFWVVNIGLLASTKGSLLRGVDLSSIAYVTAIGLLFLPTTRGWFRSAATS